jgi:hypothetical protein
MYCKVIVGHASFRSAMCNLVVDRIIQWASLNIGTIHLFGKRAWNAHLSDKTFEEATTDIDLMIDTESFSSLTLNCLRLIHRDCHAASPYMNVYTKTHADGHGRTMTIEVCGISVADMASRDTQGDFCIGRRSSPDRILFLHDFAVLRHVSLSDGKVCVLSVLKRSTMKKMLDAEIIDHHWRKEKAQKDLRKYMVYDALGFFHEDSVGAAEPEQVQPHGVSNNTWVHVTVPHDETSFQIPILAKYLRACNSVEECIRVSKNLFFWIEGDPMSVYIKRVLQSKSVSECRAIAKEIEQAAEPEAQAAEREQERAAEPEAQAAEQEQERAAEPEAQAAELEAQEREREREEEQEARQQADTSPIAQPPPPALAPAPRPTPSSSSPSCSYSSPSSSPSLSSCADAADAAAVPGPLSAS